MLQKEHKNFGNFGQVFAVQGLIPWPYFRMKHKKDWYPIYDPDLKNGTLFTGKTDKNVEKSLILYRFGNASRIEYLTAH